mmetsp:Transcript_20532/g.41387  ORF Transcript_20532/g.41387 Transcript_20532/m.41387 type:complete len:244 (+) Transcript_20532:1864-2595(+)
MAFGVISQKSTRRTVDRNVEIPAPAGPSTCMVSSAIKAATAMFASVLPRRMVVRKRVMSRRSADSAERSPPPSFMAISLIFHGHSAVMAVSDNEKKHAASSNPTTGMMVMPTSRDAAINLAAWSKASCSAELPTTSAAASAPAPATASALLAALETMSVGITSTGSTIALTGAVASATARPVATRGAAAMVTARRARRLHRRRGGAPAAVSATGGLVWGLEATLRYPPALSLWCGLAPQEGLA